MVDDTSLGTHVLLLLSRFITTFVAVSHVCLLSRHLLFVWLRYTLDNNATLVCYFQAIFDVSTLYAMPNWLIDAYGDCYARWRRRCYQRWFDIVTNIREPR